MPIIPTPIPTSLPLTQDPQKDKKAECEARGPEWFWDESTQTCKKKPAEPVKEPEPKVSTDLKFPEDDLSKFGPLRDAVTGRLSGFQQGGELYMGLSPEEVRAAVEAEANKQELVVGGQAESILEARRAELATKGREFAGQIGDRPSQEDLGLIQAGMNQRSVNYLDALASAAPGIIGDFATGFAGTAILTKGGTKGIAPTAVGVGNAVIGVFNDFVADVSRQKRDIIETPIRTLTETKGTIAAIISMQNGNPANSQSNLDAFNVQRTIIDQEYEFLKQLNDEDLNKFLGENAINQMKEYEVYYLPNGERWQFDQEMADALANPDPAKMRIPFDMQEVLKGKVEEKYIASEQLEGQTRESKVFRKIDSFKDVADSFINPFGDEEVIAGTLPIGPTGAGGLAKYVKTLSPKFRNLARNVGDTKLLRGKTPREGKHIIDYAIAGNEEAGDLISFGKLIQGRGFSAKLIKHLKEAFKWGGQQPFIK